MKYNYFVDKYLKILTDQVKIDIGRPLRQQRAIF